MRFTKLALALAAVAITAGAVNAGAATATGWDTETIIGRQNCEAQAKNYRAMGYSARCNHIHGERFYVHVDDRPSARPSTGSFGSAD